MTSYKKKIKNLEHFIELSELGVQRLIEKYNYKKYIKNPNKFNNIFYYGRNKNTYDGIFMTKIERILYLKSSGEGIKSQIRACKTIKNFKRMGNVKNRQRLIKIHQENMNNNNKKIKIQIDDLKEYCADKLQKCIDVEFSIQKKFKDEKQKYIEEFYHTNFAILEYTHITDLPLNLILNYICDKKD